MLNFRATGSLAYGKVVSDDGFSELRDYIEDVLGVYFPDNKKYLLESRLKKRLTYLGLSSYADYLRYLKYSHRRTDEIRELAKLVTITETYFFRDEAQLKAFEEKIMPDVIESKPRNGLRKVRIWSAACSSGEEPYTLAIIYLEKIKPRYPDISVEIIGTDINTAVLDVARSGVYKLYSVRNVSDYYLKKYFVQKDGLYCISDRVKSLVRFQELNLIDKFAMARMRNFDVVFLRNVLIYFNDDVRRQVVSSIYDSMNRGGYLVVGYSESLRGITKAFKIVYFEKAVAYKKE